MIIFDDIPTDAPGTDCPDHGPTNDDDCPKCDRAAAQRADALDAIDRILARNAALANARIAAQNWADMSRKRTYVIETGIHVFIADDDDRAEYHKADIDAGRACEVCQCVPAPAAITVPDVAFAPAGWAE